MATYVLVIMWFLSDQGIATRSPAAAMTSIPGYASKEQCEEAIKSFQKNNLSGICVPGPPR